MFWIRADGNKSIGMGHIMRCLTIAEELRRLSVPVCFLLADDAPVSIIEKRGFSYRVLHTDYQRMEEEIPVLETLMEGEEHRILVDSYMADELYLQALMHYARVFLLDDTGEQRRPCHTLINYNTYAEELNYERWYGRDTRLLLGTDYVPVREEFRNPTKHREKTQKKRVLVTTGGGDPYHFLKNFLKCAPKEFDYTLISGPFCTDTRELEELAEGQGNFQIRKNVTNMSELMWEADLAVSAAGSTLYELSAMGVPFVGFYYAENQRRNMESFSSKTGVLNAGDYSKEPEKVMERILEEVMLLLKEEERYRELKRALFTLIDGKGAGRLAVEFTNVE